MLITVITFQINIKKNSLAFNELSKKVNGLITTALLLTRLQTQQDYIYRKLIHKHNTTGFEPENSEN